MTQNWSGNVNHTYFYDLCYSVHPLVGDAALKKPTASSTVYMNYRHEYPVSADFYCYQDVPCYESNIDTIPWWRVDLGESLPVFAVRITLVGLLDPNVEFRVGNETSVSNNTILTPQPTSTPQGGMELVADPPVFGRYFFVTEPTQSDIRVCDVWVMTKPKT